MESLTTARLMAEHDKMLREGQELFEELDAQIRQEDKHNKPEPVVKSKNRRRRYSVPRYKR